MTNSYTTRKRNYSGNYAIKARRIINSEDEADAGLPARLPPRNQDYLVKIVKSPERNRYKPSSTPN